MLVNSRCMTVLAGSALLGIGLDQATKALMVSAFEGKRPVHLIGQFLTIDVSRNPGAAFSFAPAATVLFTCAAVAVTVLTLTKASRLRSTGWAAALGLLLAGAAGNLCDRLVRAPGIGRGAVIDFINLQHFAIFNLADTCLTSAAVLAVVLSLRGISLTGRSPAAEYGLNCPDDTSNSLGCSPLRARSLAFQHFANFKWPCPGPPRHRL